MKILKIAIALAATMTLAQPASAAVLLTSGGQLVGAKGVDVDGTLYNVSFELGSCASLFSGCDEVSDLPFTTETQARAAADALFDQVFLGAFDTTPGSVFGCPAGTEPCAARIYYAFDGSGNADFIRARNRGGADTDLVLGPLTRSAGNIVTAQSFETVAVFSVPEPAAMLPLGLGMIGFAMHRRKRKA